MFLASQIFEKKNVYSLTNAFVLQTVASMCLIWLDMFDCISFLQKIDG